MFQHYAAFKHMTVRDNVAFGLKIRKRPKAEVKQKVDQLLETVGLSGFQTRYPGQLSGGQHAISDIALNDRYPTATDRRLDASGV